MKQFAFHLLDDRRSEPVVRVAQVRDDFEAQLLADRMLRESYHHQAVEVWEGGQRRYTRNSVSA